MVYLEQQSIYLKKFEGSPIAYLLNEILYSPDSVFSDAVHNATDLSLNLLITLKQNDSVNAERFYGLFAQRQPTRESHWIYDNFVLFSITCIVRRFGFEQQWLKSVIDMSYTSADSVNKAIRDTLKNILAGNFNAKGDFHQVSIVYQFLAKDEHYQEEAMNSMSSSLWLKFFPFFEDDFLNVISIKALEVVLLKKASLTEIQFYHLNHFPTGYNKRADNLSKYIARILIFAAIALAFAILWKLTNTETQYPFLVKVIGFLGSFSGVGILAFWGWNSKLAKVVRKLIDKIFGYNPPKKISNG